MNSEVGGMRQNAGITILKPEIDKELVEKHPIPDFEVCPFHKAGPPFTDELELSNARAASHHRSGVYLLPYPYANGFPLNTGKASNSP